MQYRYLQSSGEIVLHCNGAPLELIHVDKVDKDMTYKDKVNKDKVEFLVPSRGPF